MKYPVRFIIPPANYKSISIHSNDFPEDMDLSLNFCNKTQCFCKTLNLPNGTYHYQYNADGNIISDTLRASQDGISTIIIGPEHNQGIIFNIEKSFVTNDFFIVTIGLDSSLWQYATLNIQTLKGIKTIHGKYSFFEGSYEYQMFTIDMPLEESLLAYFEITGYQGAKFYGLNQLKDSEWAVQPFEIQKHSNKPIVSSDINVIYKLSNPKAIKDFENHKDYFIKFPVDYLSGEISLNSPLLKNLSFFSNYKPNEALTYLLRDIFLETEDFNPSIGLLGRFSYEYRQEITNIPFALSDQKISFWNLARRNFSMASQGIGFQLLGSMLPEILFGEEIGLIKTGSERNMFWTKTKWNRELFHFYQKLLKLRKKYPVLRRGHFRFVLQDCSIWGIERYMNGEDSIFIFANHSQNNIIVDLTKIMNCNGPIVELLTDYPLKRKKVCTIFGESLVAYKQNSSKLTKNL